MKPKKFLRSQTFHILNTRQSQVKAGWGDSCCWDQSSWQFWYFLFTMLLGHGEYVNEVIPKHGKGNNSVDINWAGTSWWSNLAELNASLRSLMLKSRNLWEIMRPFHQLFSPAVELAAEQLWVIFIALGLHSYVRFSVAACFRILNTRNEYSRLTWTRILLLHVGI